MSDDPDDDSLDDLIDELASKKEGMFADIPQPKQVDYFPPTDPIAPVFDPGFNMSQDIPHPRTFYPDLMSLHQNAAELHRRVSKDTVLTDDSLTRVVRAQVYNLVERAQRHLDTVHQCMVFQQKEQREFNKIYTEIRELLEACPGAKVIPR